MKHHYTLILRWLSISSRQLRCIKVPLITLCVIFRHSAASRCLQSFCLDLWPFTPKHHGVPNFWWHWIPRHRSSHPQGTLGHFSEIFRLSQCVGDPSLSTMKYHHTLSLQWPSISPRQLLRIKVPSITLCVIFRLSTASQCR